MSEWAQGTGLQTYGTAVTPPMMAGTCRKLLRSFNAVRIFCCSSSVGGRPPGVTMKRALQRDAHRKLPIDAKPGDSHLFVRISL